MVKLLQQGLLPRVNCSQIIFNDNDQNEWNKISQFQKYFQCARLASSMCETYIIRAVYRNNNPIKIKIDVGCKNQTNPLSRIVIGIDSKAIHQNKGLCGNFLIVEK